MKKFVSLIMALVLVFSLAGPAAATPTAFADVPANHWAFDNIQRAYREGIINGMSYNSQTGIRTFQPDGTLTAAQFTVMLARAFYPGQADQRAKTNWYNREYEVLRDHGVYSGLGALNLEGEINRYDMATLIYNVLRDRNMSVSIADHSGIADWDAIPQQYQAAVAGVFHLGVIKGVGGGKFNGSAYMKRSEAAAVYCRMSDVLRYGKPLPSDPSPSPSASVTPEGNSELDTARREVLRLVNQERSAAGLPALQLSDTACAAAQIRANEITRLFSHQRPDGTDCLTSLTQAGVNWRAAGENIAAGQRSSSAVMTSWMNSPPHKSNILNSTFTHIGIGMVRVNDEYGYYWVQLFFA